MRELSASKVDRYSRLSKEDNAVYAWADKSASGRRVRSDVAEALSAGGDEARDDDGGMSVGD